MGCHSLLQGIFPTQGSNLGCLHCRQILYHLSHQRSQWWVCVMVNFHVSLRAAQTAGLTLFLGVSVRLSLEEISIQVKKVTLTNIRWTLSPLLRLWIEQKGRGRSNALSLSLSLSLSPWAETSISSCPQSSVLLLLRPLDSDQDVLTSSALPTLKPSDLYWNTPLVFLVIQLSDSRSWGFSGSLTT